MGSNVQSGSNRPAAARGVAAPVGPRGPLGVAPDLARMSSPSGQPVDRPAALTRSAPSGRARPPVGATCSPLGAAVSLGAARLPRETQVRVAEQRRPRAAPAAAPPQPWTVAWVGLAVAVPISLLASCCRGAEPSGRPAPDRGLPRPGAAESVSRRTFEFRQQSFSWSPGELALRHRPGRGRRPLDRRRLGRRRRHRRPRSRATRAPRPSSTSPSSCCEVCVAVGVLQAAARRRHLRARRPGSAYLLAVLVASLAGRRADRRRDHRHRGLPRPAALARAVRADRRGLPGRRVGRVSPCSCWSASRRGPGCSSLPLLVALAPALPAVRQGHPRGQQRRAGLRLRPPGGAGLAGRGRHPADRRGVRELLNAERVALWLPPYLDEEPRLVVSAENGAVWYDGPGDPDDVFRRRAVGSDRRPAAGLAGARRRRGGRRARPPRGLRPARRAGDDRGRRARATSRSATAAATSSPSPTATGPRWTRCSPTSTPRSGSSSCSPRSATTPTTTG